MTLKMVESVQNHTLAVIRILCKGLFSIFEINEYKIDWNLIYESTLFFKGYTASKTVTNKYCWLVY